MQRPHKREPLPKAAVVVLIEDSKKLRSRNSHGRAIALQSVSKLYLFLCIFLFVSFVFNVTRAHFSLSTL